MVIEWSLINFSLFYRRYPSRMNILKRVADIIAEAALSLYKVVQLF